MAAEDGCWWTCGPTACTRTSGVPGFPNLFLLVGPNTGLGHTSMVFMMEAQMRYLVDAITTVRSEGLPAVEVREDVMAAYDAEVRRSEGRPLGPDVTGRAAGVRARILPARTPAGCLSRPDRRC